MGSRQQMLVQKSIFVKVLCILFVETVLSEKTFFTGVSAESVHATEDQGPYNADEDAHCDKIRYLGCIANKKIYYDPLLKLTWFEAWEYCRSLGFHLLSLETTYEHKFVESNLPKLFDAANNGSYWTSGNDLGNEGNFIWMSSGRPFGFNRFTPGQPDNAGGVEHCVEIWPRENSPNYLNDRDCFAQRYAMCQQYNNQGSQAI